MDVSAAAAVDGAFANNDMNIDWHHRSIWHSVERSSSRRHSDQASFDKTKASTPSAQLNPRESYSFCHAVRQP